MTMLSRAAQLYLTLVFPVLAVLIGVRLAMTPAFLQFEYTRPGFPADFYGMMTAERLAYGPYAVEYLLNGEDISFLGDLRFPDGTPLFNERELIHMHDVKVVTQAAFVTGVSLGVMALLAAVLLLRTPAGQARLRRGLRNGALFTLALLIGIVLLAVLNWEFFFVTFHQVFFEQGTWVFLYSDTLIRLYPEQFWFDAAIMIGGLSVILAGVTLLLTLLWERRTRPAAA